MASHLTASRKNPVNFVVRGQCDPVDRAVKVLGLEVGVGLVDCVRATFLIIAEQKLKSR